MKPTEQRIAIAKACGKGHRRVTGMDALYLGVKSGSYVQSSDAPDYLNDLNAMHEAVATIPHGIKREEYTLRLCGGDKWRSYDMGILDAVFAESATAAQRAEAFLRTLDLWTS